MGTTAEGRGGLLFQGEEGGFFIPTKGEEKKEKVRKLEIRPQTEKRNRRDSENMKKAETRLPSHFEIWVLVGFRTDRSTERRSTLFLLFLFFSFLIDDCPKMIACAEEKGRNGERGEKGVKPLSGDRRTKEKKWEGGRGRERVAGGFF